MDFPIKNGDFPLLCDSSPEGIQVTLCLARIKDDMKKYRVLVFKDQGRLSGERQAAPRRLGNWNGVQKQKRQTNGNSWKLGNSAEISNGFSMDFRMFHGFSIDFLWIFHGFSMVWLPEGVDSSEWSVYWCCVGGRSEISLIPLAGADIPTTGNSDLEASQRHPHGRGSFYEWNVHTSTKPCLFEICYMLSNGNHH